MSPSIFATGAVTLDPENAVARPMSYTDAQAVDQERGRSREAAQKKNRGPKTETARSLTTEGDKFGKIPWLDCDRACRVYPCTTIDESCRGFFPALDKPSTRTFQGRYMPGYVSLTYCRCFFGWDPYSMHGLLTHVSYIASALQHTDPAQPLPMASEEMGDRSDL